MIDNKSETFKFLNWKLYNDAQSLYSDVEKICKKLPKSRRYEITNQLLRCSLSIVLNIAEGSGKESDKELGRYLGIAMGSLYETLACLDALHRNDYLDTKEFEDHKHQIELLGKQIGGFRKSLKS